MPSAVTVKTNKPKWPKKATIRVGCLQPGAAHPPEAGTKGRPITVGELFAIHEFGLGDQHERSMIRAGFDEMHEQIEAIALEQMQIDPVLGAERTAIKAAAMFRNRVAAGLRPGLAERTIKSKERRGIKPPYKPLIETGVLRSSIVGDAEVVL